MESGQHFDRSDARHIAKAARYFGAYRLRAVLLEDLQDVRNHLEVDASEEGLFAFSRECAHFNFALLPEKRSFALICTTNDYYLVAGSKVFVEKCTGKDVASARSEFERFARDNFRTDRDRNRLIEVSRLYK